MASLAIYLQKEFARLCPKGWIADIEKKVLSAEMERILGYSPRVDILLEKNDGSRRLWIEFEISRADPVANHAKFATSHLFQPQLPSDTFVSMISPHVARGRRNLAANTIFLMRNIGMQAFQTILFPTMQRREIKRLNHLDADDILKENLDVQSEIDRAFIISESCISHPALKIHYVGDVLEVMLNVHSWNEDILTEPGLKKWGKRIITYFVYDPRSKQFAPAKYCAYTILNEDRKCSSLSFSELSYSKMTIEGYSMIDASNRIFD